MMLPIFCLTPPPFLLEIDVDHLLQPTCGHAMAPYVEDDCLVDGEGIIVAHGLDHLGYCRPAAEVHDRTVLPSALFQGTFSAVQRDFLHQGRAATSGKAKPACHVTLQNSKSLVTTLFTLFVFLTFGTIRSPLTSA